MSGKISNTIVTNGLVLCLDAANIRSYPGTGNTWSDLSINSYNGNLINGPTFSNTNVGSIIFDGTNDYCQLIPDLNAIYDSPPLPALATDNFTIDLWCLPTQTHQIDGESTSGTGGISGQKYLIRPIYENPPNAGAGISIGTNGVSVYEHSAGYIPALLVHQTTITRVTNIVVVYTSKRPSLYINSQFARQGLLSPRTAVTLRATTVGEGFYGYFGGSCQLVRYYNRSLSATEILQNYNSSKKRFNL
jgi:hypothetical protein